MKFLKNNLKVIIAFIIGLILAGGIVYAAISSTEVSYTREGTNIKNVGEALDELFNRNSNNNELLDCCIMALNGNVGNSVFNISRGLVPILSQNTGSNGEAICNTPIYTSDYDAYKAFNGNTTGDDKTNWASYVLENNYGYIGYHFTQPTEVNVFYVNTRKTDNNTGVCMKEFILQGSNDNSNWTDLTDVISHTPKDVKYYKVTKNQGKYYYYRLYGKSDGAYSLIALQELQFFYI